MPQSENRRLLGKSCPSSAPTRERQRVESSSLGLDTLSVGMQLPMLGGKIYLTIAKEARERGKTRSGHPELSKCCHPANSRLPSGEQGRPTVHHRPCKSVLSKNLHRTYKRGLWSSAHNSCPSGCTEVGTEYSTYQAPSYSA